MFRFNISIRNVAAMLSGLIISAIVSVAMISGFSARAQTATIPLGTYTALAPNSFVVGTQTLRRGEWQLSFLAGGKFLLGDSGIIGTIGTYTVAQDRVEFTYPHGVGACAAKGVYQWSLQGNKLSFTLAAGQSDDCNARKGALSLTYFKTDQLESLWKNIGPEGGGITALLAHDNKLFAGARDGAGVFVSTDNGQSWRPTRGTKGPGIYAFAAFNSLLFAGTDEGLIFLSLDGGETWEVSRAPGPFRVTDFALSNGKLYAGTAGQGSPGILRLTDNPKVWENAGTGGLTNLNITALAAIGGSLFAGTDGGGVFVSQDGNTWMAASNGLTTPRISTLHASGTMLYAASVFGSPNEVFFSENNGQSWRPVGNGLAASFPGLPNEVYKLAASGGKLFAASSNGIIVHTGGPGGQSGNWSRAFQGSPYPGFTSVMASGNALFAGAAFDGVMRSFDGGANWSQINNGLAARTMFGILKSNGVLYGGTGDGVMGDGAFISTNDGQTWARTSLPIAYVSSFVAFEGKVFACTAGGLYVTSDQGQNWTRLSAGLPSGALRVTAAGNVLYATSETAGVFRSADGGQSWTAINTGLISTRIFSLVAKGTSLFAGTVDRGASRSDNQGQSWTLASNGLPAPLIGRVRLAVSGDTLLAGVLGQAIYRSTDNGNNWAISAGGFLHPSVYNLYVSGGNVFAAGGDLHGVMRSTDNGLSWNMMNNGLDMRYAFEFCVSGPALYATGPAGVYASNMLVNHETTTSAASYSVSAITAKTIVAAFGVDLALSTEVATSLPLPTTLAGTTVKVRDSNGVERPAPLFFVSAGQVNYQIPAGTAAGTATVTITNGNGIGTMDAIEIKAIAPSIFSANASGSGAAAAVDAITGAAGPFNATMANGQPNILSVFGTGLGADATDVDGNVNASVTARIDGAAVTLQYAGRAPGLVGLNQFNVVLPAGITSGPHPLTFTRGGVTSNTTTLVIR